MGLLTRQLAQKASREAEFPRKQFSTVTGKRKARRSMTEQGVDEKVLEEAFQEDIDDYYNVEL